MTGIARIRNEELVDFVSNLFYLSKVCSILTPLCTHGFRGRTDLLYQTLQYFSRSNFNKCCCSICNHLLNRLRPFNRSGKQLNSFEFRLDWIRHLR